MFYIFGELIIGDIGNIGLCLFFFGLEELGYFKFMLWECYGRKFLLF